MPSNRTSYWREFACSREGCISRFRKKFLAEKNSAAGRFLFFSRIKKSSGSEDSARTVRCELSTNSHEPLQHKWKRSPAWGKARLLKAILLNKASVSDFELAVSLGIGAPS
jgi:hypothetical protein